MTLLDKIAAVVKEPPPAYAFEVSEKGIASAQDGVPAFRELPEGTIAVSPLRDNVHKPDVFTTAVGALYRANNNRRRRAALILPDYAARVQVLDFDEFPAKPEEQLQLIRFRVRKTIPFDVESAAISYHAQPPAKGKVDVVAAILSLEILAHYESPFRAAGYHTGYVTTSGLAALALLPEEGVNILAKLAGRVLTVTVLDGKHVKLIRCLDLENIDAQEILSVLHPTVAYVEDELQTRATRLVICGLGENAALWGPLWEAELNLPVEPAQSRYGTPGPFNAGLLAFLHDGGIVQ